MLFQLTQRRKQNATLTHQIHRLDKIDCSITPISPYPYIGRCVMRCGETKLHCQISLIFQTKRPIIPWLLISIVMYFRLMWGIIEKKYMHVFPDDKTCSTYTNTEQNVTNCSWTKDGSGALKSIPLWILFKPLWKKVWYLQ